MAKTNEPVKSFRQGGVAVNVFVNEFETKEGDVKRFSFSLSNAFTKDDGKTWEYNNNYSRNALSSVRSVTRQAEEWSYSEEAKKLLAKKVSE